MTPHVGPSTPNGVHLVAGATGGFNLIAAADGVTVGSSRISAE